MASGGGAGGLGVGRGVGLGGGQGVEAVFKCRDFVTRRHGIGRVWNEEPESLPCLHSSLPESKGGCSEKYKPVGSGIK